MASITKGDCMIVTDLNQAIRYFSHVVDVCFKLHDDFQDNCLFSVSDQSIVAIVFGCFRLTNYKNIVLRHSMNIKQHFNVEESLN